MSKGGLISKFFSSAQNSKKLPKTISATTSVHFLVKFILESVSKSEIAFKSSINIGESLYSTIHIIITVLFRMCKI